MEELSMLKVEVKAWERAFKLRENRAPTKDDIKKDPHGFGERYALYRKLAKSQTDDQSLHAPSSSRTTSSSALPSSGAGPSRSTPRNIPTSDYPTTPTPHSRRSSAASRSNTSARTLDFGEPLTNRPAKRTLPSSPSKSPNSSTKSFITPKKPRPSYSGPIHDPNPINPFSSPVRSASSRSLFVPAPAPPQATGESPFLHANSPRKLKELLEANSLRRMKARHGGVEASKASDEITPRTKARLRLAGDFITPTKEKGPIRKRGQAKVLEDRPFSKRSDLEIGANGEAESEDEFGPSPMKPEPTRTFTELLQAADEGGPSRNGVNGKKRPLGGNLSSVTRSKETSSSIMSFFSKQGKTKVKLQTEEPVESQTLLEDIQAMPDYEVVDEDAEDAILQEVLETGEKEADMDDQVERLSTPPLDTSLDDAPPLSPPPSARATKVVEFSDDEVDEWDPEGAHIKRRVVITGTRRNVQRRGSFSSGSEADDNEPDETDDRELEQDEDRDTHQKEVDFIDDEDSVPALTAESTTPTHSSPRSTSTSRPLPLLSLLSLRSPPRKSQKMADLRVRAIFNPSDAALLEAVKRGQDVHASGEGEVAMEEELLDRFEAGVVDDIDNEGDDDWEEDCEGWKRDPLGLDDEGW